MDEFGFKRDEFFSSLIRKLKSSQLNLESIYEQGKILWTVQLTNTTHT